MTHYPGLVPASFLKLAPEFGQALRRHQTGVQLAINWLWGASQGHKQYNKAEVLIQDCQAPELTPIGDPVIDGLLASVGNETGFLQGNESNKTQSSWVIPAYCDTTPKRAFASGPAPDGRPRPQGYLQSCAITLVKQGLWLSDVDRRIIGEIEQILSTPLMRSSPQGATTVIRVMHSIPLALRSPEQRSPVTHGWLLIGATGNVLHDVQTTTGEISTRMMTRARHALTLERTHATDVLRIEGGTIRFVHRNVLDEIKDTGLDISNLDLSQAKIGASHLPNESIDKARILQQNTQDELEFSYKP